jgi:UDP-glucuronate decarboxylase
VKLLVTGGAGFLGSHLSEALLGLGHEVVCADNFYTGSLGNIEHLQGNSRFEVIEHDVTEPLNLECDGIFNLACPASPVHYQRDPVATMRTSVLGAVNLLDLARRNGARILQASTSEIYGDPEVSPQPEEYWGRVNPIGVRSCYDEGKRAAETLFFDYHRQYSVDIRVARIFNTYGPRMAFDDGRVVSNFIIQALGNLPITVYGDGEQTRSFCYVSDLIEGLIRLFFAEQIYQPINLGNPEPTSILELANQIIIMAKSSSKIQFLSLPLDDPKIREPNIEKATSLLNWKPKVNRRTGLENTISNFKSRLGGTSHG